MTPLESKYAALISATNSSGATHVAVREQNDVLYIDGEVPTGEVKDQLWAAYEKIDPDFRTVNAAQGRHAEFESEHSNGAGHRSADHRQSGA